MTEEASFNKTIDQGLNILSDMIDKLEKEGKSVLSGDDTFKLYDTYGFPLDLTKEILEEKGLEADEEGFKEAMDIQRKTAREARGKTSLLGVDDSIYLSIDASITSEFVGYNNNEYESKVLVITTETEIRDTLNEGEEGTIITEQSPFYATMGGQINDIGTITTGNAEFVVYDTLKINGDKIGHVGRLVKGDISVNDTVSLVIDTDRRKKIAKNHSATHLLQKALRDVLGDHVQQAGSLVDDTKLRFDFTHFSPVTKEELEKIEDIVNAKIEENIPVDTNEMSIDEARKTGAMALFGEKYGEVVRVVKMGDFSIELCGGTHVKSTGDIRAFKIISEGGVAAGVRRIEAVTAGAVFDYYKEAEKQLHEAAKALKSEPANIVKKIESMHEEIKELRSKNESLNKKLLNSSVDSDADNAKEVNGVKFFAIKVEGQDMNAMRELGDSIKEKNSVSVIVVASVNDGKVNLIAMASDEAVKKGAHAGNIIKAIASCVGGGGGGRPNMAQAGGKNPAGVDDALAKAYEELETQIK